jgi:hypothetical protein
MKLSAAISIFCSPEETFACDIEFSPAILNFQAQNVIFAGLRLCPTLDQFQNRPNNRFGVCQRLAVDDKRFVGFK